MNCLKINKYSKNNIINISKTQTLQENLLVNIYYIIIIKIYKIYIDFFIYHFIKIKKA